jgi:hypothetical protein
VLNLYLVKGFYQKYAVSGQSKVRAPPAYGIVFVYSGQLVDIHDSLANNRSGEEKGLSQGVLPAYYESPGSHT